MKKTLDEIKKSVPKLQGEIASLTSSREKYVSEINRLASEEQDIMISIEDDQAQLDNCKKFISANEKNTNPRIANRVKSHKQKQQSLERVIKTQQSELAKIKKDKTEIEKKPEYVEIEEKLGKAQKDLSEIFDVLEQDPQFNEKLQLAVEYKYKIEIDKQKELKENYSKLGNKLSDAVKDDSKDGLKSVVEELSESKKEREEADNDPNADSNAAKKKYFASLKKFQTEIKNKFGIDVDKKDVNFILEAISKNQLDNLMLPSATLKMQEADAMISKLEKSRDARLEELESKKVTPQLQNTDLIEENRKAIEEFRDKIDTILVPQIETLSGEIDDLDTKIEETDNEIAKEEADLGEPSDEYKEIKEIEQELKDNHIIIDELVPGLDDENSEVSKLFNSFRETDLKVREAFQKCKTDDSPEAMQELQDAIAEYQTVATELQDLSGYDPESWQNYLKEVLNDEIEFEDKTLSSAYYHTDNENLKLLEKDSAIKNNEDALDAYDELVEKTEDIDKTQEAILNGDFGAITASVDGLFNDPDKGYYAAIKGLEKATGLGKGKGLIDGLTIFDLLKNSKLIQPGVFSKAKGFFKKIFSKLSPKRFFKPQEGAKELVSKYNDALTPEVKEEIDSRRKLESLKKSKSELEMSRTSKDGERTDLIEKSQKALDEIQELEDKNEQLAREDAARTSSVIEHNDDIKFVTIKDDIVTAYTDTRVKDDDDGR